MKIPQFVTKEDWDQFVGKLDMTNPDIATLVEEVNIQREIAAHYYKEWVQTIFYPNMKGE